MQTRAHDNLERSSREQDISRASIPKQWMKVQQTEKKKHMKRQYGRKKNELEIDHTCA